MSIDPWRQFWGRYLWQKRTAIGSHAVPSVPMALDRQGSFWVEIVQGPVRAECLFWGLIRYDAAARICWPFQALLYQLAHGMFSRSWSRARKINFCKFPRLLKFSACSQHLQQLHEGNICACEACLNGHPGLGNQVIQGSCCAWLSWHRCNLVTCILNIVWPARPPHTSRCSGAEWNEMVLGILFP